MGQVTVFNNPPEKNYGPDSAWLALVIERSVSYIHMLHFSHEYLRMRILILLNRFLVYLTAKTLLERIILLCS